MLKLFTTQRTLTINIEKPCDEDWDKMRPVQGGRHCDVCAKRVTDFSGMSAAELARYAKANGKVCGRIATDLLNKPLVVEEPKKGGVLGLLLRAAVLVGITSSVQAKSVPAYTIHHNNIIPVDEPTERKIKLIIKVTDKATGKPLSHSKVSLKDRSIYSWLTTTDNNGYIITTATVWPQDTIIEMNAKSHFYTDKKIKIAITEVDEMTVDIQLDRINIPDNTVYGIVGTGDIYEVDTISPTLNISHHIEVFGHPEISAEVNALGEYMLTLPDSMLGKRVYLNRVANGNIIHTDGVTVTKEPVRLDFIDPIWVVDIEGPPIITYGGTSILEYKWDFKLPIFSIGDLAILYVVQTNWAGTEMYVRAPFTRKYLPLYKSHWFRSGAES